MNLANLLRPPTKKDSLLKHRQIRSSYACATATAHVLRKVVGTFRSTDVSKLIERVQRVGHRLVVAQRKELAVGNIVRRVLGVIRDEAEEDRGDEADANNDGGIAIPPDALGSIPKNHSEPSPNVDTEPVSIGSFNGQITTIPNAPISASLFSLLSHPPSKNVSPLGTPGSLSPRRHSARAGTHPVKSANVQDLRAEVTEGIQEIIDELNQADEQIAAYAQDHIHSNEIILVHTASRTIQKFLLKAALKRRFTVIYTEVFHSGRQTTRRAGTPRFGIEDEEARSERFHKSLAAAGITVILVPYSAAFALMSRVNKILLSADIVLADGSLTTGVGAKAIAKAARVHRAPVMVLSGVFKLSPVYPFDVEALIEYGDPSQIVAFDEGALIEDVEVENPLFDYVPANLVDLYITNLCVSIINLFRTSSANLFSSGGHAPSYLYRIVEDHYRVEDMHTTESGIQ
ncbi:MAG: hypothetical protein Q9170_001059 [Blastenia crenularia]